MSWIFLGNQGRQRYDHWQPTGTDAEVQKKSTSAFLDHLQSMMDHDISICCRIYKLEETNILPGETPNELVDRLRALADHCNFPTDDEKEWNVQYWLVHASANRELVKKLLALPIKETTAKMLEVCRTHNAINSEMEVLGLGSSKTVHAIHKGPQQKGQWKGHKPPQQQRQQHSCGNCTKQHAPGQASCPAKDSQCWACGKTGHWKAKCKMTKRKQVATGQCAPQQDRGTRPRQNRIHEVGTDDDPHMDEVRVAAVLNQVGTGMASVLNQVGAVAFPHSDQPLWLDDTITIADVKTNGTEAFTDIEIPADIGKCQLATLRCKVDTGAGGNVMPLCTFTKLFPKWFDTDGHPPGLPPSTTCLTAYNSSPIRQFGTFRTHIDWTPQGTQTTNHLHTWWYVADTPGPAILGLPACNKLGIVELNCAVDLLQKRTMQQKTPTTECQWMRDDLEMLQTLSSREDLISAYPDCFEGIRCFPGTYHITLWQDAQPVVDAPQKCPIAMWPLVSEKLDEWEKSDIITPVEEPTDWVSSLAYSMKPNGRLRLCLNPKDLNNAIKRDHHRTLTVEEITHQLAGSTRFTKLDGTSSYLCIVLDYESSLLTTFKHTMGTVQIHMPTIWTRLLPRHISADDGTDPWALWRSHWNCWWHCHTWQRWCRTWQMPSQSHTSCPWIWTHLQPGEMWCESHFSYLLQYSLWQRWGPSRPLEGRSHPQAASTRGTTGTPEVPPDDYILVTIYPFSLYLNCTLARTTQEGHRVYMEQLLPGCLWHSKEDGLHGHDASVIWCTQACHYPSRCITEGTRSSTPARWMPCPPLPPRLWPQQNNVMPT